MAGGSLSKPVAQHMDAVNLLLSDTQMNSLSELPDELLKIIFANLGISDKCYIRPVCRKWNNLINDDLAGRKQTSIALTTHPERDVSEPASIDTALAAELKIKPTDVVGWRWPHLYSNTNLLRTFLGRLENLQYIEIEEINRSSLFVIEEQCPKLTGLGFHRSNNVSEEDWLRLINIKKNLTILACGMHVPEWLIKMLVNEKMMPNLCSFRIICDGELTESSEGLTFETFAYVGPHFKKLFLSCRHILRLCECDRHLESMIRHGNLKNLIEFESFAIHAQPHEVLEDLCSYCPKLERLLFDCWRLGEYYDHHQQLKYREIELKSMGRIGKLANLRHLELWLKCIADFTKYIQLDDFEKLQKLMLFLQVSNGHNRNVENISSRLPYLHTFEVSYLDGNRELVGKNVLAGY